MVRRKSIPGLICQVVLAWLFTGAPVLAQTSLIFAKPGPLDYSAGISEEILKEAYSRIGITVTTQEFPGERALKMSNSGTVDGEVNRIHGIRKKYANLRMVPVAINAIEGLAFTNNPDVKIRSWEDLRPYRLGLRIGAKYAEYGTAGMRVAPVKTNDQVFSMLGKHRTEIAISTRIEGVLTIHKLGLKNIRLIDPPLVSLELFHFLHKKHEALLPRIQKALEEMAREGRIEAIKTAAIKKLLARTP
jgi:polar amino acid transport system substrate-binding protein